jgi:hypothetical protein
MIGRFLRDMALRFSGDARAMPTQELLAALFEVGETILGIEWDGSLTQSSTREIFGDFVGEILKSWAETDAQHHLESAFKKSNSPCVSAHVFVISRRQLQPKAGSSNQAPLPSLDTLGKILLPQLERAAADGTLANAPIYSVIIQTWKDLGGAAAPKNWIEANMAASADFLSKLTMGLFSIRSPRRSANTAWTESPAPNYTISMPYWPAASSRKMQGTESR